MSIHTRKWHASSKPSEQFIHTLMQNCDGYCGADIKHLCAEAVMLATKEKFPEIYQSNQKLDINISTVKPEFAHFYEVSYVILCCN